MRWEYRDPEKKTFVSDGEDVTYFYVPADRQVIRREQSDARDLPVMLLSGRADIVATFEVALEAGPAPACSGSGSLRAKPEPEIEHLYVDVDAADRIRAILVARRPGQPQPVRASTTSGRTSAWTITSSGSRCRAGSR